MRNWRKKVVLFVGISPRQMTEYKIVSSISYIVKKIKEGKK